MYSMSRVNFYKGGIMARSNKAQIGVIGVIMWVGSLLMAFAGLGKMTEATVGVGLMAFACYLGILARIAQASFIANKQAPEE